MRSCSGSSPSSSPAQGCPLSSRLLGQGPDLWLHSELGDTRTPEPSDAVDQCRKSWPVGQKPEHQVRIQQISGLSVSVWFCRVSRREICERSLSQLMPAALPTSR